MDANNARRIRDPEHGAVQGPVGEAQEGGGQVDHNNNGTPQMPPRFGRPQRRISPVMSISGEPPVRDPNSEDTFDRRSQAFFQTKVMRIDNHSITINLATLQRARMLRLQRDLVLAAYKYRFTKRSPVVVDLPVSSHGSVVGPVGGLDATSTHGAATEPYDSSLHLSEFNSQEGGPSAAEGAMLEEETLEYEGTTGAEEQAGSASRDPQSSRDDNAAVVDRLTTPTEPEAEQNHPIDQDGLPRPQGENGATEVVNGQERAPDGGRFLIGGDDQYDNLLRKYTEAVRDWQFMMQCHSAGAELDPFILTTRRMPDYELIQKGDIDFRDYAQTLPPEEIFDDYHDLPQFPQRSQTWDDVDRTSGGRGARLRQTEWQLFLERLIMAFTGGAFLVGPMLLMVLVNTLVASLATTAVCVLAFGLVMSLVLEKKFDVLSSTAAYAAVLVVFIGTSTGSG
ncbi:hypothetical protein F5144DRAFT_545953 [Chaetomium tenue]|uniref:Uncharacterized protein n=1 Tax=Chaetomium tenue TaxID=1854479 RepID=A0ACB7PAH5_9PEZI|nr:hypothetical protein F5144DRAFT_545953 [Chaetomium globosum]